MKRCSMKNQALKVFARLLDISACISMIFLVATLTVTDVKAEEEEVTEYLIEYKIPSTLKTFTYSTGSYICIDDTYTYVKVSEGEELTLEATASGGYLIYEVYVDGESIDQSLWNVDGLYKAMKYTFNDEGNGVTREHTFEIKCISTSSDMACPDSYFVEHYHMNIDGETYTLYETVEYTFDGQYGDKVYGEQKTYEGFTAPDTFEHVIMKLGENTTMKYYYERNKYYFINNAYNNPDYVDITGTSEANEYYHGETIYLNANITGEFADIYSVVGWTDGEIWYEPTDSFIMPKEDVSLYVETSVTSYRIQFDANGGEGAIADTDDISYFDEYTLPNAGFTRDGYALLGWNTNPDATAVKYSLGDIVKELTTEDSITLYAIWGDLGETSFTVEHYVMGSDGVYILAETEVIDAYTSDIFMSNDLVKEKYNNQETTFFLDMVEDEYSITMFLPKAGDKSVIKMYYARVQHSVYVEITYREDFFNNLDYYYIEDTITIDLSTFLEYYEEVYGGAVIEKIECTPADLKYNNMGDAVSFDINGDTEIYIYLKDKYAGMCKTDGVWYYYTNGAIDTSYTGMAKNEYGWWYIKEGKLDLTYTGMATNEYGTWYMKNGKLDTSTSGLIKSNLGWIYLTNGKLDTTYTGLAKNQNGWWYVKEGKLDRTYTGMAKNQYGWWYVTGGKLDLTYTGMAKNQYGWWYVAKGKLDRTYTGMATNEYGTWYMKNGKLDTSTSGLIKSNLGWIYLTNGKLDTTYTGLAKNQNGWWYVKEGKLDRTYTGMAKNQYGWWYVTGGKLDLTYTGMAKNQYGWWYVAKGKLDRTYTGMATNENGTWYMKNGKLDRTVSGLVKTNLGWVYLANGKLNTAYTGIAQNEYGLWYIKEGKLDRTYTGRVTSNGTTYDVVNGKIVE